MDSAVGFGFYMMTEQIIECIFMLIILNIISLRTSLILALLVLPGSIQLILFHTLILLFNLHSKEMIAREV